MVEPSPVLLAQRPRDAHRRALGELAVRARALIGREPGEVLAWATGVEAPLPAGGRTVERWELLATVGAQSLSVARALEPHLDAVAILGEAGVPVGAGRTYGVWAAEGPGVRVEAREGGGRWVLDGTKPWCSLAGSVSHALVTAWVGGSERRLLAVAMDAPGVRVEADHWVPAGLRDVVTVPVTFVGVDAEPVGASGWYLERDGFWWGGIGVAAVWYGGAVGLARTLAAQLAARTPDQVALLHLGTVDAELAAARATLLAAADEVDSGHCSGAAAVLLGARARQVVATAAERVLHAVAHALGPGPLSTDADHVARVADLGLYLRQHHGERDAAGLGALVLEGQSAW